MKMHIEVSRQHIIIYVFTSIKSYLLFIMCALQGLWGFTLKASRKTALPRSKSSSRRTSVLSKSTTYHCKTRPLHSEYSWFHYVMSTKQTAVDIMLKIKRNENISITQLLFFHLQSHRITSQMVIKSILWHIKFKGCFLNFCFGSSPNS